MSWAEAKELLGSKSDLLKGDPPAKTKGEKAPQVEAKSTRVAVRRGPSRSEVRSSRAPLETTSVKTLAQIVEEAQKAAEKHLKSKKWKKIKAANEAYLKSDKWKKLQAANEAYLKSPKWKKLQAANLKLAKENEAKELAAKRLTQIRPKPKFERLLKLKPNPPEDVPKTTHTGRPPLRRSLTDSWSGAIGILSKATPGQEAEARSYSATTGIDYPTALAMQVEGDRSSAPKSKTASEQDWRTKLATSSRKTPPKVAIRDVLTGKTTQKKPLVDIHGDVRRDIGATLPKSSLFRQSKKEEQARYVRKHGGISAAPKEETGTVVEEKSPPSWSIFAESSEDLKRRYQAGMEGGKKKKEKPGWGLGSRGNYLTSKKGPAHTVTGYNVDLKKFGKDAVEEAIGWTLGGVAVKSALKVLGVGGKVAWGMLPQSLRAPILQAAKEGKRVAQPLLDKVTNFITGKAYPSQPQIARTGSQKVSSGVAHAKTQPLTQGEAQAARGGVGQKGNVAHAPTQTMSAAEAQAAREGVGQKVVPKDVGSRTAIDTAERWSASQRVKTGQDLRNFFTKRFKRQPRPTGGRQPKPGEGGTGEVTIKEVTGLLPSQIAQSGVISEAELLALQKQVGQEITRSNPALNKQSASWGELWDKKLNDYLTKLVTESPKKQQLLYDFVRTKLYKSWEDAIDILKSIYNPGALIPLSWAGAVAILKSQSSKTSFPTQLNPLPSSERKLPSQYFDLYQQRSKEGKANIDKLWKDWEKKQRLQTVVSESSSSKTAPFQIKGGTVFPNAGAFLTAMFTGGHLKGASSDLVVGDVSHRLTQLKKQGIRKFATEMGKRDDPKKSLTSWEETSQMLKSVKA